MFARSRLLGALGALLMCVACRSEGRVGLRFSLEDLPAELTGLFLHVRVQDEAGDVLGGSITEADRDVQLGLSVPHGDDRRAVVELRDSASPTSSNVIAYGVSAPFSLHPNDNRVVEAVVVMRRVPAIVDLVAPSVVNTSDVPVSVTADRGGVVQLVLAQDPSLTFGRQVFDFTEDLDVTYDIDAACRATNTCTDGRRNVFARLIDEAGYSSTSTSTPVVVDTQPPRVLAGAGSVRFVAPAGLLTPTAASAGVTVRLSFVFDEPVTSTPSVTLESGLDFTLVSEAAGAYIFERIVVATDPEGVQRPRVQARDEAGNEAPVVAPDLAYVVDHVPPDAPRVDVPGAIVYRRIPYRDASEGGASFTVVGAPGAVEGGARVVVYDRPDAFLDGLEVATRAGAATADDDGSFVVQLAPVDRAQVYVLVLDAAGNPHTTDRSAARVRDVEWRLPAGVRSGSQPPVEVLTLDRLHDSARLDHAGVTTVDASPLALADGLAVESHYDPRWTERLPAPTALPDALRFAAIANDPARDRVVLYGGRSAGDVVRGETWEWDGRQWESIATSGVLPSCDDGSADGDDPFGAMSYHGALGLSILICRSLTPNQAPPLPAGGVDAMHAFGWDGARWRSVTLEGAPGGRSGAAFAYDPNHGRTVMFGGNSAALVLPGASASTLGDTWELEAVPTTTIGARARLRWIERSPGPPARDRHAMVYAPSLGGVAMFGGISNAPDRHPLDDLWIWDGTTWTEIEKSGAWPPARALHALVYDERSGHLGVIGGVANEPISTRIDQLDAGFDDAWWFDGATWTRTATAANTPRGPGLAATGMRSEADVYVLSGAAPGAAPASAQTFVADATRWSDRTPSGAVPPQTELQSLLYDPGRDLFWLYAAPRGPSGRPEGETWFWSESGWRIVDQNPATGRAWAAVFDVRRNEALLLADSGGPLIPGELAPRKYYFVNRGAGWTATSSTAKVQPRRHILGLPGNALFYDRVRSRPVSLAHDDLGGPIGTAHFATQELYEWTAPTWTRVDRRDTLDTELRSATMIFDDRTALYFLQFSNSARWKTFTFDGNDWAEHTGTEGSWSHLRGIVADSTRQDILVVGAVAGRARTWSWDGASYRDRVTTGTPPPRAVSRGIAYDHRRRRVVVAEAPEQRASTGLEAPAGAVYLLDLDPDAAPAVAVRARLAEGGVAPALVERITVTVDAGGVGFATTSTSATPGAVLSAFDRRAGRWSQLAVSTAGVTNPARLAIDLDAEDVAPLLFADDAELLLAVHSSEGLGAGAEPARVVVDRAEVVVWYRLP
ncbi:MAG: hypothetical protein RMA76_05310 [Deltaproteobacteria bacterium]